MSQEPKNSTEATAADRVHGPWVRALGVIAGVVLFAAVGIGIGLLARPQAGSLGPETTAGATQSRAFAPPRTRPKVVLQPRPGSGPLRLRGTIVDQSGAAVANAAITAELELGPGVDSMPADAGSGASPDVVAVADSGGAFELVGLQAGRYRLRVEGDDIFTSEVRFVDVPRDAINLIVARIIEVQGVVVVGNTPMADVEVSLRGDDGGVRKAVSGRDGRFSFVGLSGGVYDVWVASGDQAASVQRVRRMGPGPFADVVLQVEPASIVHGVVRDADTGEGISAALVLRSVDLEEPPRYAVSRGDGSFRIEGVINGKWTAEATAAGYLATESVTFSVGGHYAPTLLLSRGGVIEGRVVDQHGGSILGAVITVRGRDGERKLEVSQAARQARLQRFRGQEVTAPLAGSRFVPRGELGVLLGPIPYPPPPGAVMTPIRARRVAGEPGTPPGDEPSQQPDAGVLAVQPEQTSDFKTDHEGRFRITGLSPGRYRVFAAHRDYADGMSLPLSVAGGTSVRDVTVRLLPGVTIAGTITDERGKPVLGAVVSAEGAADTHPSKQAVTSTDGRYQLPALAHAVTLRVTATGYGDAARAVAMPAPSMGVQQRVEDFVLTSANAVLRGRVVDPSQFAVRDARVVIVDTSSAKDRHATTDANGLFAIDGLAPATYQVRVEHPGYPSVTRRLATTTDSDITLRFGGGIEGTVRDGHTAASLDGARVNATGPGKQRFDTASSKTGAIELVPLSPGAWTLRVSVPGYIVYRKTIKVPAGDAPRALTVRDLLVELHRGATVEGVVRDASGERVRAARVWIASRPDVRTTTDEHGRYRLPDAPTGDITIEASRSGQTGQTKVALRPGDHVATIDINLE